MHICRILKLQKDVASLQKDYQDAPEAEELQVLSCWINNYKYSLVGKILKFYLSKRVFF